ncbi:TPA: hypothetical protein ACMDWW_000552 [Vibrio cholerae]
MAMNIEQRLEQSAKSIEQSSQKAHDFAEKDTTIQTCAGSRDSLPKVSRIWQENFARQMNQHATEFQDRFALSQQSLPWQAGITISDSLQRYHVGVQGEEGYKEFLPNPLKLPFETAATLADDLSQERWLENGVPNKHWTESKVTSALEKSLGVNARVWPKDRDLVVGDVIPLPQDTEDGLPITHLVVDSNVYAMSQVAIGSVTAIAENSATIGGVSVAFLNPARLGNSISYEDFFIDTAGNVGYDTSVIAAVHEFANDQDIPVIQKSGTIKISSASVPVLVKTSSDLHGCTFDIDDGLSIDKLFYVKPTVDLQFVSSVTNTDMTEGQTKLSQLSAYEGCIVSINSSEIDLYRNGSVLEPIYKRDIVGVMSDGALSHALCQTFTQPVSVIINRKEFFKLEFRAPKLKIGNSTITSAIYSERNSVKCYAAGVELKSSSNKQITTYFEPHFCEDNVCYGQYVDEFSSFELASNYFVSGGSVIRQELHNYSGGSEWAAMDGNTIRDGKAVNVHSARVGVHAQAYNFTAEDCTLFEKAIQVTGKGRLQVIRCKKVATGALGGAGYVGPLVDLREDYGGEWDGDIVVDYPVFECGSVAFSDADFAIVRLNNRNLAFGRMMKAPRLIKITNPVIKLSSNPSSTQSFYLVDTFRYPEDQTLVNRKLPEKIEIINPQVEFNQVGGTKYVRAYRGPHVKVLGYTNNTIEVVQRGSMIKYSGSGAQAGETVSYKIPTADFSSVTYSIKHKMYDMDVDAIFSTPSSWSLKMYNCNVYNIEGFAGAGFSGDGVVEHYNSVINGGRYSSGAVAHSYYNCTAGNGVQLSGGFVRAVGNSIVKGASVTFGGGLTKSDFVNGYYSQSYFEPL